MDVGSTESVFGVAKLRNEIYVLCQSCASPHTIRVFEDRNPYRLQKIIKIAEIKAPQDIESSEKENCLYVSDYEEKCVWKIIRETGDEQEIIKWLTTDYKPGNLSMSADGQLLVVNDSSSILMVYGSDAELVRLIRLSSDIDRTIHLVETSIGNFIILHYLIENEEVGKSGAHGGGNVKNWGISELTRDGQMVIRRFIPSNKTQHLSAPHYLSIDSDDQVFVAEYGYGRVILLDSDLNWDRIVCTTKYNKEETNIQDPSRLYYDEENKQLIVGGGQLYIGAGANVYTLNRE